MTDDTEIQTQPTDGAPPVNRTISPFKLLLAMPPALSIAAQFSLLVFLGPVGDWLHDHWFPVTRALWDKVFIGVLGIDLSPHVKDYLTAIVLFLPSYLMARKKPVLRDRASIMARRLALPLGLVLIYILAQRTFSDFGALLWNGAMGVVWIYQVIAAVFIFVTYALILPVAFHGCESMLTKGRRVVIHKKTGQPVGRLQALALLLLFQITLLLGVIALIADLSFLIQGPFPPKPPSSWQDVAFGSFPWRGFALFMIFLAVFALAMKNHIFTIKLINGRPRSTTKPIKAAPKKQKKPRDKDVDAGIVVLVILLFVGFGMYRAGPLETLFSLLILLMVGVTTIRFPERLVNIAVATAILLLSAFAVDWISSAKALLEGLPTGELP